MATNQQKKVYKSMQGKTIDMDMLRQRNELTPAVGNARVNARGDELGPGGEIIRKREDVMREYYETSSGVANQNAVRRNRPVADQPTMQAPVESEEDWEEDPETGDFVKSTRSRRSK